MRRQLSCGTRALRVDERVAEDATYRLAICLSVIGVLALGEFAFPFRKSVERVARWPSNVGLSVLNALLVRMVGLLVPGMTIAAAAVGQEQGLMGWFGLGELGAILVGFVLLDLAIYAQHRLMHWVPLLWRLHRVHHADLEFDVSTAVRFHPVEMLVSLAWKVIVVSLLGVPVIAVFIFEVMLNASSMFSHANVRLPNRVETLVRYFIVTPDMHRIHHSILADEVNSNYGFNFSFWDRIFGTYRPQALNDAVSMPIGLPSYRSRETFRIGWLLLFPFHRGKEF